MTNLDINAKPEQYEPEPEPAKGMIKALTKYDINETKFLKDNGITIGLWGNAGITYNAESPDNNFNGPVTFADRSGEFQLNQLNLFIQRAVATEGDSWDFGGRFDCHVRYRRYFYPGLWRSLIRCEYRSKQKSGALGILIFLAQMAIAFTASHYLKLIWKLCTCRERPECQGGSFLHANRL